MHKIHKGDKDDSGPIPLFQSRDQFLHMFLPPQSRGIGKHGDPILFIGDAFHFHQSGRVLPDRKVHPAVSEGDLPLQGSTNPIHLSLIKGVLEHPIGQGGMDADPMVVFVDKFQTVRVFATGVIRLLQHHWGAGEKHLIHPSRIGNVNSFPASLDFNHCLKTVGAIHKDRRDRSPLQRNGQSAHLCYNLGSQYLAVVPDGHASF